MKRTMRSELYKVLNDKMLYIAIAIGLVFCAADVVENATNMQNFNENLEWLASSGLRAGTGHAGFSLFYLWMGLYSNTRSAYLFCMVWPVLAAIAYGWSYNSERGSGVYNQIAARTGVKTYYISKYIAVFVSGGLAVSVPVLLNLLANALVCPYADIPATLGAVTNSNFLSELYYTCPWAYGLLWCGMTFLCGGTAACFCFVAGTMLRHSVMVILVPYAIYVVMDAAVNVLRSTLLKNVGLALSPLRLINSVPGFANPEWLVLLILGVLMLLSFGVGYWQVVKHELA